MGFPALFDLTGRVAVVTGASGGLGGRFATVLASAGASVMATGRRASALDAVASEDERIKAFPCDVTDPAARAELVTRTVEMLGGLDILVNTAGIGSVQAAESIMAEDFRRTLDVNLTSLFDLTRLGAGRMLEAGGGSVINVASIFGVVGSAPLAQAAYAASKGAVVNLTRQLAGEWAPRGVRVNALAPGWFETDMTTELFADEQSYRWILRNTPMGRTATPDELDGALLLLASDAGSFITGHTLLVDGGWTAR